jgi:MarR family transcriptional regulator, organic hydroperoxide resistance regulator
VDVDRPVGAALVRISVLVTERYELIGSELGVDSRAGRLLVAVHRRPETVGSLGARLRIPKSTMTSLLNRMLRAGLVVRETDAVDRRSATVSPTERGREVATLLEQRVRASVLELLGTLDRSQRAALAALLEEVIAHGDELDDAPVLPSE